MGSEEFGCDQTAAITSDKPNEISGQKARRLHLDNLFQKLDKGSATPHKTRQRVREAGRLAAIELQEQGTETN